MAQQENTLCFVHSASVDAYVDLFHTFFKGNLFTFEFFEILKRETWSTEKGHFRVNA